MHPCLEQHERPELVDGQATPRQKPLAYGGLHRRKANARARVTSYHEANPAHAQVADTVVQDERGGKIRLIRR
jgi:hypothetical protein